MICNNYGTFKYVFVHFPRSSRYLSARSRTANRHNATFNSQTAITLRDLLTAFVFLCLRTELKREWGFVHLRGGTAVLKLLVTTASGQWRRYTSSEGRDGNATCVVHRTSQHNKHLGPKALFPVLLVTRDLREHNVYQWDRGVSLSAPRRTSWTNALVL